MNSPRTFGPAASTDAERSRLVTTSGHLLDIIIRPDTQQAGAPEQFLPTTALIDTGASKVCIDYRIAQQLNLRQINQTTLQVVGGTIPAYIYLGELEVPALGYRQYIEMIAAKVGQSSYSALLGRSFLSEFIATFDGPHGYFTFARPQQELSAAEDE